MRHTRGELVTGVQTCALPICKVVAGLQALDKDLESLLSAWFDVGLLELRPLTWDSPASLLEKLITYEAVHEIRSWDDLRHRVAPDRRCYAYFHPQKIGRASCRERGCQYV